jgi:hypothetical protein
MGGTTQFRGIRLVGFVQVGGVAQGPAIVGAPVGGSARGGER